MAYEELSLPRLISPLVSRWPDGREENMRAAGVVRRARRGVGRSVRTLLEWEIARRFDADLDDTNPAVEPAVEAAGRVGYENSAWFPGWLGLRRLQLTGDDVIADLGAGKGLMVLLAAELPVRRVIGVELVEALTEAARLNLERNRDRRRAGDVQVVTANVLHWPVPADLSVVYLYNPFFGSIFRSAISRLFEGWDASRRPLRLVYRCPWEHNWLLSTGRVRVLDVQPGRWPHSRDWWRYDDVIVTYGIGEGPFPRPRGIPAPRAALQRWRAPNDARFAIARPGRPTIWSR